MTPNELLDDALWRTSDVMRRAFAQRMGALGLTPPLALVLRLLDQPRPMRFFADELLFDPSYITSIIDALEAKALVERRGDPSDRRVKLIALTDAGNAMRGRLHLDLSAGLPGIGELSDDERGRLAVLLLKAVGCPPPD